MNDGNLIQNSNRTPSEARENGRKGGKASGESRRRKKKLKTELANILKMDIASATDKQNLRRLGVNAEGADMQTVIAAAMVRKAANGDVKAFIAIRDTLDEAPKQKVEVGGEMSVKTDEVRQAYEVAAEAIKAGFADTDDDI